MGTNSSGTALNRVISLNGLGRERSPGHRILGECRDQLVSSLCVWLRGVATPISEELFVLADSTRERLQQTRYLDLRADIEKDWSHLVETFRRDLTAEAERCQSQDNTKESPHVAPLEVPDFEGLSLMDDEDLSEHIVIREFSAQLSESCDEELYTLNRRVAALLGQDELLDSSNPLAPGIVCRALSDACTAIGSDAEQRLILLRRLERHLHQALPPIYRQINAKLIERGILPDLKRNYRNQSTSGERARQDTAAGAPTAGGSASGAAPMADANLLEALQRIALSRTAGGAGGAPALPGAPGLSGTATPSSAGFPAGTAGTAGVPIDPEIINRLLLVSLNELQHAPRGAAEEGIVNQVRQVRDSESAQQLGGLEAVTLDIVAMLFDFIFDDAHIPVAIKALISRLQIPVLKVAMLNPGFFSDRQHPTRRFLGSISGIAIRWGDAVDEKDPFYAKLAELVERIQSEFESDVEIFAKALAELETFVGEHESEEDDTALTAAHLVIQREQDAEAWERAQRAVRNFRSEHPLTPLIDDFVGEHWLSVLKSLALEPDESGTLWPSAIATMQDLAWSVEAKKTSDERLKLIGLLPGLLAQINKGLDRVDAPAAQRSAFFDALVKCHSAALKGESTPLPPPAATLAEDDGTMSISPPQEGDLLVTRSIDNGVEVEEVILVGATPVWRPDERAIHRQVEELKRGDWVEFRDEDGNTNRERLNWISPQRGILLFSNHRAAKAISIAPDALARQIRDGKASIVRDEAIFERALSGAIESLSADG